MSNTAPCPALLVSPFLPDATNPAFLGSWASSSRFRFVPYGAAPLDRGLLLSSLRGVLIHRQPKEHERPFRGMWLLTSAHAFFAEAPVAHGDQDQIDLPAQDIQELGHTR